jgi:hypothetical protein
MRFVALILIGSLAGCAVEQCPPSTMEIDGLCVRREEQDAGTSTGGATQAGGACRKAGELRCAMGSEVSRQRCVAGQWQDAPPCSEASVCQRAGADVGTCVEIADRCPELEPAAITIIALLAI